LQHSKSVYKKTIKMSYFLRSILVRQLKYYSNIFNGSSYLFGSKVCSNSNQITFSCWLKPSGVQTQYAGCLWIANSGNKFAIFPNSGSSWGMVCRNSSGSNILSSAVYTIGSIIPGQWSHLLMSIDTSQNIIKAYINDVLSISDSTVLTDQISLIPEPNLFLIGANAGAAAIYRGLLSEYYFTNEYIDISVEQNRRKFITANKKPVYLGHNGILPTGRIPIIYLHRRSPNWKINSGTSSLNLTTIGDISDNNLDIP